MRVVESPNKAGLVSRWQQQTWCEKHQLRHNPGEECMDCQQGNPPLSPPRNKFIKLKFTREDA